MNALPAPQESRHASGWGTLRAWFHSPACLLALVAIACVVVYFPSRNGPFVFDDTSNIVDNPHIRMTRLDPTSLWRAMVPFGDLNLRPLSFLTFALNHLFGGYAPFGYHVVNVAILLLSIPVAYLFALRLGVSWLSPPDARATALGATAIWALHPLLTNGVSYIVQRMTSLYTLFSLVALLFFLNGRLSGRTRPYALAAISLLCALASKETALFTPLLALLILWVLPRKQGGAGPRAGWALAVLVVASQVATVLAAHYAMRVSWINSETFGAMERLMTEGRVVLRYLELFILPLPSQLTLDYAFPLSTSLFTPPSTLLAAAFHAGLIAVAVLVSRRRPLLAFGIFGFYLLQLPEGTIMPLDLIFEHRTYFPIFFLALALMDLLQWVVGRRAALAVALALCALWGSFTFQRNQVWADPVKLWDDTVAKAPGNARALYNLGTIYMGLGNPRKAVAYLQEAVRLEPNDIEALNNLGNSYTDLGNPGMALEYLQKAVRLKPGHVLLLNNLGRAYGELGNLEKAVECLREALRIEPDFASALNNLGRAYGELGRLEESVEYYRRAIAVKPDYATAHYNLGMTLLTLGRTTEADTVRRALREIDPALAQGLRSLMPGTVE